MESKQTPPWILSLLEVLEKQAESSRYLSIRVEKPGEDPQVAEHHEGPLGEAMAKLFSTQDTSESHEETDHEKEDSLEVSEVTIRVLKNLLYKKYQLILAYINYGDQLHVLFRDGIFKHFQEHIEEERAQAYELAKKLISLGEQTTAEHAPIPVVSLKNVRAVFEQLLELERSSVSLYQQLFMITKDNAALNGLAQNGALQDQQHADDMLRYLRAEE